MSLWPASTGNSEAANPDAPRRGAGAGAGAGADAGVGVGVGMGVGVGAPTGGDVCAGAALPTPLGGAKRLPSKGRAGCSCIPYTFAPDVPPA